MSAAMHCVTLSRHPQAPAGAVECVAVSIERGAEGRLSVTFSLHADIGRLRIPTPCPSCRGERLWEHTCFEAFVASAGTRGYHEINLAPSGAWAIYAFRRYREPAPLSGDLRPPAIAVRRAARRLDVEAVVRPADLCPALAQAPLRVALSAVVEDAGGVLSYWALRHPQGSPDFHHPEAFALTLAAPSVDPRRESS
jgi:hypothetical protein